MSKEVKRQHYVPKTYLKHFGYEKNGENFIHGLSIDQLKEEAMFDRHLNNVCLKNDIYTLPGETPEERMLIEHFYSRTYETHYDYVYRLLTNPEKVRVTDRERKLIISTVITMFYRTMKLSTTYNNLMGRTFERVYDMAAASGADSFLVGEERISIAGKSLKQIIKEQQAETRPMIALTQLRTAFKLIDIRMQRDGIFVVKYSERDCNLITSDNPVNCYNPSTEYSAPFHPDNIFTLPLDSKHALKLIPNDIPSGLNIVVRNYPTGYEAYINKMAINFDQCKNADKLILGSEDNLKRYLKTKPFTEDDKNPPPMTPEQFVERAKELENS